MTLFGLGAVIVRFACPDCADASGRRFQQLRDSVEGKRLKLLGQLLITYYDIFTDVRHGC